MSDKLNELKAQADSLGINYANNIGEGALQKKISEVLGDFDTEKKKGPEPGTEQDTITIRIQEDDNNPHDVQVGVNGKTYLIKRGEDVAVPMCVFHALNDAVEDHFDGKGNKSRRHSYPFSRV